LRCFKLAQVAMKNALPDQQPDMAAGREQVAISHLIIYALIE
jgi:hypothetical protein